MDEPEVLDAPTTVPEGETVPEAVPASKEELPHYDEDKLIKVKGKVKKPVKPDDTERNIQLEKLSAEIKNRGDRIAEIKAIREARRSRGVNPEAAEHKKKKEGLAAEWNAVLKQKMHIREEFQRANTEREVIKNELREARSKIPRGSRLDTLEADIQSLEYRLEHESLSASDEKKVHQQLTVLTPARPLVRQAATLEEKLKVVEANRASAKSRLDGCDTVLEGIKEKERVAGAALDEIRRERDEANVDMPALEVEKQECWEIIQLMRAKMNEVRDEFNGRWKEWSEQNKHYNAWRRHDSYRQFQERQVAREQRDAERNGDDPSSGSAAAASSQSEPYESEIFTIDQLLTYLRRFAAPEDTVAKAEQKAEVAVPQGLKPFKRKEEDLSFFNAVKKKPGKGNQPAAVKQDKPAPAEVKRKLNHSLEILKTFMTFGLDVPQSTTEIPATVEKVEAKKQDFLERRKKAKEAPSAPVTQVLPANGELNGHNEEEEADEPEQEAEEEAEVAAQKEEVAEPPAASAPAAAAPVAAAPAAAAVPVAAAVPEAVAPKEVAVKQPVAVEAAKAVVETAKPVEEAAKPKVEAAKPKEEAAKPKEEAAKPKVEAAVKESPKAKEAAAPASEGLVVTLVTDAATHAVSLKLTVPAGL